MKITRQQLLSGLEVLTPVSLDEPFWQFCFVHIHAKGCGSLGEQKSDLSWIWLCSPSLFKWRSMHCTFTSCMVSPKCEWFSWFQKCSEVPTSSLTWIYRRVLISQLLCTEAFRRNRFYLKSMAIFIILPVSQTEWKLFTSKIENLVFSHNYFSLFTKWMSHPCVWSPLCFRTCFEYPIWQVGWGSLVFPVKY